MNAQKFFSLKFKVVGKNEKLYFDFLLQNCVASLILHKAHLNEH